MNKEGRKTGRQEYIKMKGRKKREEDMKKGSNKAKKDVK